MKRIAAALLILLLFLASSVSAIAAYDDGILADGLVAYQEEGDLVAMIQVRLRDLGYFLFKPTGKYLGMTRESVIAFQTYQVDDTGAPIIADGTVGQQSLGILFSPAAMRAPIGADVQFPSLKSGDGSATESATRMTWDSVKAALIEGGSYTLTDDKTGETFSIVYAGGEMHAEVECATSADTETMRALFGGSFNYYKRPMLLSLNDTEVACSLQGQPHGEDFVSGNGMEGTLCLYFDGSRSHVGGLADVEHANNIHVASN